jgi:hypothetical protein
LAVKHLFMSQVDRSRLVIFPDICCTEMTIQTDLVQATK